MYTLIVVETISLDGVMQAPGRPDEDPRGGFDLGGWAEVRRHSQPRRRAAYPNSTALVGDAADTVRTLKDRDNGDLVVLGSGVLVQQLIAAGLVDRLVLTTIPIVLGQGARLFDGTFIDLEVRASWTQHTFGDVAAARRRCGTRRSSATAPRRRASDAFNQPGGGSGPPGAGIVGVELHSPGSCDLGELDAQHL
jgi:hypothetical protein